MPFTYFDPIQANYEILDLNNSIARINANAFLARREKIRLTMQLGIRSLHLQLYMRYYYGQFDYNAFGSEYVQTALAYLLNVSGDELLEDEEYFRAFCACAYYFNELHLMQLCEKNGVNLLNDPFLTQVYFRCLHNPELSWLAKVAFNLISSAEAIAEANVAAKVTAALIYASPEALTYQPDKQENIEPVPLSIETRSEPNTINILSTATSTNDLISPDPVKSHNIDAPAKPLTLSSKISMAINQFDAETVNQLLATEVESNKFIIDSIVVLLSTCTQQPKGKAIEHFIATAQIPITDCILILEKSKLLHCVKSSLIDKLIACDINVYIAASAKFNILNICSKHINKQSIDGARIWDQLKVKNRQYLASKSPAISTAAEPLTPVTSSSYTPATGMISAMHLESQTVDLNSVENSMAYTVKPEIKAVDLSAIQQLKQAIVALDGEVFNAVIARHPRLNKEYYTILQQSFASIEHTQPNEHLALRDFLLLINISDTNSVRFVCDPTIKPAVRAIIMHRILRCNNQELFVLDTQYNIHEKAFVVLGDKTNHAHVIMLNLVLKKILDAHEEAAANAKKMFELIYAAQPNQNLEAKLKKHEYAINICNDAGQTLLMAAIETGLSKSTILYLIAKSNESILVFDNTHCSVFHYWAKYLNLVSSDTINSLWLKFREQSGETVCILSAINSKRSVDGNTFLHDLLLNEDLNLVSKSLNALFTVDSKMQFSSAILVKNFAGDTPLRTLHKRGVLDGNLVLLLLRKVSEIVLPLFIQYTDKLDLYFPHNTSFFTSGDTEHGDVLYSLMLQQNFMGIMSVINERNILRLSIQMSFSTIPNRFSNTIAKNTYEALKQQVLHYFGMNEFLFMHEERSVFDHFTDYILLHPELEPKYNTQAIRMTELESPISESLTWKKIVKHFSASDQYSLTHNDLNTYRLIIKASVDEIDRFGRSVLDYAILSRNPAVVNFIVDQCRADITYRLMLNAIASIHSDNDVTIADLLFKQHKFCSDPQLRIRSSYALMNHASLVIYCPTTISWLISNGFNTSMCCPDSKVNILQLIILHATAQNLTDSISVIEALLSKKDEAQRLIEYADPKGHTCLHYALKHAVAIRAGRGKIPQNCVDQLFEVLLRHGASKELYNKFVDGQPVTANVYKLNLG